MRMHMNFIPLLSQVFQRGGVSSVRKPGSAGQVRINQMVCVFKLGRPRSYVFVESIPKSPVGKLLRRKLLAGEYKPESATHATK